MLKIVLAPNKILHKKVKPVKKIDNKIKKLIKEMEKTLVSQNDPPGVGLAAPQVGVSLAIFIIKNDKKTKTKVFINPKVLKKIPKTKWTEKDKNSLEGCLSIPKIWGPIKRLEKIYLQYQNIEGKKVREWFLGLMATIVDHEIDHLNGVLFTQRAIENKSPLFEEKNGELENFEL